MFPALRHFDVAHQFLMGYMDYYFRFKLITKRARIRFERRDWHGIQADARGRITLYRDDVDETAREVAELLKDQSFDADFWAKVKAAYAEDIDHFNTRNIGETFYNSVYRHFHQVGANRDLMFVSRTGSYREYQGQATISIDYDLGTRDLKDLLKELLAAFPFDVPWDDKEADITLVAKRWQQHIDEHGGRSPDDRLEVLSSLFYRNKSAYIVGRFLKNGTIFPFILPLLHPEGKGIFIDALLLEADQVTSIFSYHRSYFLADITVPSDMVDFLHTFMPTKAISELYNAIGFEKHGKTVFYRELVRHFRKTKEEKGGKEEREKGARTQDAVEGTKEQREDFVTAPGIAGMVMYVFTMPTLNMVFKIIRDKFAPPKQVTPAVVKEKYDLVKRHDRVGRMADSYLFEKLALPLDRFSPECLAELRETAATKVEVTEDTVLISHVYVEKKMTPLNLYLNDANEEDARKALRDYGRAIKQLASANIFPGDLLLKNFGVTRVKRVVFYDYDEIELVTDCNFRHIPEAKTYEQEMASEPWYSVRPNDIFPEEFPGFLMRSGPNLTYLREIHGEIFDADFWNDLKQRLQAGEIMDVYPYRTKYRFLR
jgi:isocitrate dehydrogenase kinase/phosphatase